MDAIVGMEGAGPSNGKPRKIGLLLSSKSCTALDYVAVTIAGFDPMSVPTVRLAQERGVGPSRLEDVRVLEEQVQPLIIEDFEKTLTASLSRAAPFLINTLKRFIAVKPIIDVSNCRRCGECYKACPPNAIALKKATGPEIDYSKCIRCYCCQELCPEGAITVSAPLIRRLLKR